MNSLKTDAFTYKNRKKDWKAYILLRTKHIFIEQA
ncbi:hypothetical protein Tsp_11922, partial [Trichinella spiralis]